MLSAKETEIILEHFFADCLRFQKMQYDNEYLAFEFAIKDVEFISADPYTPMGAKLDVETKKKFIQKKKEERK